MTSHVTVFELHTPPNTSLFAIDARPIFVVDTPFVPQFLGECPPIEGVSLGVFLRPLLVCLPHRGFRAIGIIGKLAVIGGEILQRI